MVDTVEESFWMFVAEMYFLGLGLFAAMVLQGAADSTREPE